MASQRMRARRQMPPMVQRVVCHHVSPVSCRVSVRVSFSRSMRQSVVRESSAACCTLAVCAVCCSVRVSVVSAERFSALCSRFSVRRLLSGGVPVLLSTGCVVSYSSTTISARSFSSFRVRRFAVVCCSAVCVSRILNCCCRRCICCS